MESELDSNKDRKRNRVYLTQQPQVYFGGGIKTKGRLVGLIKKLVEIAKKNNKNTFFLSFFDFILLSLLSLCVGRHTDTQRLVSQLISF